MHLNLKASLRGLLCSCKKLLSNEISSQCGFKLSSMSCIARNCQAFCAHLEQTRTEAMGRVSEASRASGEAGLNWLKPDWRQCSAALSAFSLPLLPLFLAGGSLASLLLRLLLLLLLLLCLHCGFTGSRLYCVHVHGGSSLVCSTASRWLKWCLPALLLLPDAGTPQCCQVDASLLH